MKWYWWTAIGVGVVASGTLVYFTMFWRPTIHRMKLKPAPPVKRKVAFDTSPVPRTVNPAMVL